MHTFRNTIHRRIGGPPSSAAVPLVEGRLHRLLAPLLAAEVVVVVALAALVWHSQQADSLDQRIATAVFAAPGRPLRQVAGAVTVFGGPAAAILGSVLVAVWAWLRFRDRLLAAFCPASVIAASATESIVKKAVDRTRPVTALLAHEHNASFPSGHATAAAALAFSAVLVVVAARVAHRRLIVLALLAYTVAISASRLILGVHYLTDVVAATALSGAVVLLVAWACTRQAPDVVVT